MRRLGRFLLRNWPLKVGAVLLATVLYSGLVLSENVRSWSGTVPVEVLRPPTTATLLSDLEPVTQIRYRAPLDVGVLSPGSFRATVDLEGVTAEPGGPPVTVRVTLEPLDPRINIVDFVPQSVQVRLDPLDERQVPVDVDYGNPEGVDVGTPQRDPAEVTVRGASSRVAAVRAAVASVTIDASALNVDRDVELVAVDEQGNQVTNVVIEPERARVRITVARQLANRTLPVVPQVIGDPPVGYRIDSVDVEPLTVTVSGEEAVVMRMELVSTDAVDVTDRQDDFETTVALSLPPQVTASGVEGVRISVEIGRQEAGSSTYSVAVVPMGARSDLSYTLATNQVSMTLAGPVDQLAAIDATQLLATVRVGDLEVGRHTVEIGPAVPAGLELVAVNPPEIVVVVEDLLGPESPSPEGRGGGTRAV